MQPNDVLAQFEAELPSGKLTPHIPVALANEVRRLRSKLKLARQWQVAAVTAAIPLEVLTSTQPKNTLSDSLWEAIGEGRNAVRNLLDTPNFQDDSSTIRAPAPVACLGALRAAMANVLDFAIEAKAVEGLPGTLQSKVQKVVDHLGLVNAGPKEVTKLMEYIDALVASYHYADGWIPVTDYRPANTDIAYLVAHDGDVSKAFFVAENAEQTTFRWRLGSPVGTPLANVSHWQPAPKGPVNG